jgi:alpha-1,6-mannosyltransferase
MMTMSPPRPASDHFYLACSGLFMLVVLAAAAVFYNMPVLAEKRLAAQLAAWILIGGTLTAYLQGYRAVHFASGKAPLRRAIVGFAIGFGLLAILIPPFHSTDIYSYINIGWQQADYGLNPYTHSLNETPGWRQDPMFFDVWRDTPSAYGFLFSEISYGLCRLGGGHYGLTVFLFKLLGAASFGLTGWLVWQGCRRLKIAAPERCLYLFLWNPLLLIHIVSQGHNDLIMGLCTAAGVLCAVLGGWLSAVPLLATGVLIKYGAAVVLPLALLYLIKRHGVVKTAAGLGLGISLAAASATPYFVCGGDRLPWERIGSTVTEMCNSFPSLVFFPYEVAAHASPTLKTFAPQAVAAMKVVFWIGFLLFYVRLLLIRLVGPYGRAEFIRDSVLVQFVMICLVSSKFYPWYLGMFLPLVFWLPSGDRLRRAAIAISCAEMLAITFIGQSHGLNVCVMLLLPLAWSFFPERFPRFCMPEE